MFIGAIRGSTQPGPAPPVFSVLSATSVVKFPAFFATEHGRNFSPSPRGEWKILAPAEKWREARESFLITYSAMATRT